MASFRHIALGTVAAVAVGAGLYWGWGKFSESREAGRAADVQAANDAEVTSGVATKLLWGDTHLHTANSIDAFGFGVKLGPEEALRFARGEEVTSTWGIKAKKPHRPTSQAALPMPSALAGRSFRTPILSAVCVRARRLRRTISRPGTALAPKAIPTIRR